VDAAQGRLDVFGDAHDEDVDAEDVLALLESDRVARAAAAAAARREAPDDAARDAAEGDGGEIAAAFRGYTFAILLAPSPSGSGLDDDDFASAALEGARLFESFADFRDAEAEAEAKRALLDPTRAREGKSAAAAALARRDVADDPETHLPSRFGEAARVAATLAVSLRLRGASVWRKGRKGRKGDDENENEDEDAYARPRRDSGWVYTRARFAIGASRRRGVRGGSRRVMGERRVGARAHRRVSHGRVVRVSTL
jgi:hypothetical protein